MISVLVDVKMNSLTNSKNNTLAIPPPSMVLYSMLQTLLEYIDEVHKELESLSYPEMILDFRPEDVARPMTGTILIFYGARLSHRICALTIWGMTMHYQVMPSIKEQVKH